MHRVVLFGPPGAGKGTQGGRLSAVWKVPHIASGDILRRIMTKEPDSEFARAALVINSGGMVTDAVAAAIIFRELGRPQAAVGFILDGFPRNRQQAEALDNWLADQGNTLDAAIALEIDEETLIERLMGRLTCPNCGETYHIRSSPPRAAGVCDRCGAHLAVREDDQPLSIAKRARLYRERTAALYGFYERSGRLRIVDAEGDEDAVLTRCLRAISPDEGEKRACAGIMNESLV